MGPLIDELSPYSVGFYIGLARVFKAKRGDATFHRISDEISFRERRAASVIETGLARSYWERRGGIPRIR